MDSPSPVQSAHPISELVDALLASVQLVAASDEVAAPMRPAEFVYEIDQLVSTYLADNHLSSEQYDLIQQDVINSLAHQLVDDSDDPAGTGVFDEFGNAGLTEVASLLDDYCGTDHHDDIAGLAGSSLIVDDGFAGL